MYDFSISNFSLHYLAPSNHFQRFYNMRKNVFGRQFKRDANERKALFKNLLTSLVLEERITTTEAKAKAIKGAADKLVTKAKKGGDVAMRALAPDVRHEAASKLIEQIAPRFMDRQGGYTRIIRVGRRVADNAPQVIMEWVVKGEKAVTSAKAKKAAKVKPGKVAPKAKAAAKTEKVEAAVETAKAKPSVKKESKAAKSAAPRKQVTRQKKG
jgi:large subunit ribosomal protein L17